MVVDRNVEVCRLRKESRVGVKGLRLFSPHRRVATWALACYTEGRGPSYLIELEMNS